MQTYLTDKNSAAWYVVHTKPRQEVRALENLENQGFECFLPMIQVQRLRGQRVCAVTEPMFSRYLFIRLDDTTQSWAPIRSTLGVSKLVSFGHQPAKVLPELIAFLRTSPLRSVEKMFKSGSEVWIASGVLKGLSGIYETEDGDARAFVLIELLGQQQKIRIEMNSLRVV
jgi:transcriptional antiterminator RfaH